MTREELLRILDFIDTTRRFSQKTAPLALVDPRWNIISYVMRRHLEGRLITITSAAASAEVPYGTAMRRLTELVDEGFVHKRPRSKTGKSFSLHPTRILIEEIERFATEVKSLIGGTFGFNADEGESDDYYFGGYYMASRILPYPSAMRKGIGFGRPFRILGSMDPTFKTLKSINSTLNEFCGGNIEIINLPLDELLLEIKKNAQRKSSEYDIMAVDLPWIGQLANENIIEPLDDIIAELRYNLSDFYSAASQGSSWQNRQYGLPIQPTAELLFCREDLLNNAGLEIPKTTDDVLNVARALHQSSLNLSGIVMNYRRGTPVAHTFVQTLADFGQSILNLNKIGEDYDLSNIEGENYRPRLDSEAAYETAEYLMALGHYSHPESYICDWDRRIRIFTQGKAAMSFGWSIRAASFELDETAPAHGKVAFAPHPHAIGARTVSPIGGFSLTMPSGLDNVRKERSWKMMEYLTRPELLKLYVQKGNLTSPRFSTSADPEVHVKSSLIGVVDKMEQRGELQSWPRPPVPEISEILNILGNEIYFMLQGQRSIEAALGNAQNSIDKIMRANGRY